MTLDLVGDSREYIEELQQIAGCNTKAELFKHALNVFDYVCKGIVKGGQFFMETQGERKEIVFPFMINKRQETEENSSKKKVGD